MNGFRRFKRLAIALLVVGVGVAWSFVGRSGSTPAAEAGASRDSAAGDKQEASARAPGRASVAMLQREAEEAILRAMQTRITKTYSQTPLSQVLQDLASAADVPLWIDVKALKAEAIPADEPVSLGLRQNTAQQALNRILPELGLTWLIDDEVLKVTTRIEAEEIFFTRVYDVSWLFSLLERDAQTTSLVPDGLLFVQFGGTPDPSFSGGGPVIRRHASPRERLYEVLIDTVQQFAGYGWHFGWSSGRLSLQEPGLLIVRHIWDSQEEVASLLAGLRSFIEGTWNGKSFRVAPRYYPHAVDAVLYAKLASRVELDARDKPLSEVLKQLEESAGVEFSIDVISLQDEDVAPDVPVTANVPPITLHSALKLVLEPHGLTSYVEDGAIVVSTRIVAYEQFHTVLYDVRDLAGPADAEDSLRKMEQLIEAIDEGTTGPWNGEAEGVNGSLAAPLHGLIAARDRHESHQEIAALLADLRGQSRGVVPPPRPQRDPHELVTRYCHIQSAEVARQLEHALVELVAPESWKANGGNGVVRAVEAVLIIRQTRSVHRELEPVIERFGCRGFSPNVCESD